MNLEPPVKPRIFHSQSCMHYPYDAFLRGTGLTVKLFRLQWYTTALNRPIIKWAHNYPKIFAFSFDIGVFVAIFLLPLACILHFATIFLADVQQQSAEKHDEGVSILLPGVNLPLNEIWYYIGALAVCSFVHEMGHGIAAVLEDVQVTGFGYYIMFVFPMAYADISTEQLNALKIWKKLRILCAGIWHNVALSLIAYVLFSSLSVIFMPLYSTNMAVIVTDINRDSPVYGTRGLDVGNVVTKINNCKVTNIDSWYDCLLDTIKQHPAYCITTDFVRNNDESIPLFHTNDGLTECCDKRNVKNVCFEYVSDSSGGILELQPFMCLNVRNVVQHSNGYCEQKFICSDEHFCLKPMLNNATTIMQLARYGKPDVMYIGHPADISRTVRVSEYIPKMKLFSATIPDAVSMFLKYIVVFSFGLAFVNIIPCFAFDGQHITSSIVVHCLAPFVPERNKRDVIAFVVTCVGSAFFGFFVVKIIWTSLVRNYF